MTYKFPNHDVQLIDPAIESVQSAYTIDGTDVRITATLNANGNKLYGVDLGNMPNTPAWGDAEVMAFASSALQNFLVI